MNVKYRSLLSGLLFGLARVALLMPASSYAGPPAYNIAVLGPGTGCSDGASEFNAGTS
jgi:hypothetical protein